MGLDPVQQFLLGVVLVAIVLSAGTAVARLVQSFRPRRALRVTPYSPAPFTVPKEPTQLKDSIEISVQLVEPPPAPAPTKQRERREFRFRQYSQFHGEEVYYWYRRDARTGEVLGSKTITVREFWGQCYDD